jgi:GntR family transcriptional repressor for pyruvate dehydrogenase complex
MSAAEGRAVFSANFFAPIKPHKVSQQLINVIRQAIVAGEIEEGDKLPNEQDLMHNFSVSRQTMREALCALETMGLIKVRPGLGGGAFVTGVDIVVARDGLTNFLVGKEFTVHHITEVRLALEPTAAMTAATSMSEEEKGNLRTILDQCRETLARGGDPTSLRRMEITFHEMIVRATRNPIWMLLHNFAEHVLWDVKTRLKTKSAFSVQVLRMHDAILDAIERGDPEEAKECMCRDIRHVEAALEDIVEENAKLKLQ